MKVQDVMTREVWCAVPEATLADVAAQMKRHRVGAVPICTADERLVGIITDRDIAMGCAASGLNPRECATADFMTKKPVTVAADAEVEQAAEVMQRARVHRLPVTADGRLVGIVSLSDLATSEIDPNALVALLRPPNRRPRASSV